MGKLIPVDFRRGKSSKRKEEPYCRKDFRVCNCYLCYERYENWNKAAKYLFLVFIISALIAFCNILD